MNLAVEITTLGPSINVSTTGIETLLDWINQRPEVSTAEEFPAGVAE
jgi:hypothetical protein